MATNNSPPVFIQDLEYDEDEDFDDRESLASLETDDGEEHSPEKIIAEVTSKNGFIWYLVKWQDCPVLRSSWESRDSFANHPWMLEDWLVEKQKQEEGKSTPLDVAAFNKAVLEVELAERQRRILRRFKRSVSRVLSIVSA
jgi:hypothetical protein